MKNATRIMHGQSESTLRIYVFSYNRPEFLNNCVKSMTRLAPDFALTIVDDNSDEPRTRRLIDDLSRSHNVIHPPETTGPQTYKTGGLYPNKNLALEDAARTGATYAFFVHHDMQLVRPIRSGDLACFDRFFEVNTRSMELQVCFMKLQLRQWDEQHARLDESNTAYLRSPSDARGHKFFSGSGVFNVERTKNMLGEIRLGEKANEAAARELNARMGFYAWPFLMWLPFPVSYRGKARSIPLRTLEYIGGGGFHPINDMSTARETAFLNRSLTIQPVAERYLECPGVPRQARYWSTMGGHYNVSALERGWRRRLGKLIRKFNE